MKRLYTLLIALLVATILIPCTASSQATKRVLIEDFTSSTCPPCATFNPGFHAWLEAHRNNITIVSYHMNWPSPGTDPMYMANPTQNTTRRTYYGVNAIPQFWMDGLRQFIATMSNIDVWYNLYLGTATPVAITVNDTRIAPDSIVTNVTVQNLTALPSGTYTLKVYVVERDLYYPPGSPGCTNGETDFPDVFRTAVSNMSGDPVSSAAGTYNFQYRFRRASNWVDSNIYTIAFVQNENDKTLMNTKSSRFDYLTGVEPYVNQVPANYALSQNYPNPFNPSTVISFNLPVTGEVSLKLYDILGHEVQNLVEGVHPAGVYNITVDGSNLSSGIYFYTLRAGSFVETKKMTLIK